MKIWSAEIKELESLYSSIKGRFPDLEKELERLIKAEDENMVLLYSRRCLEVIITDLCECELKRPRKTEPLQGIIDKLHKEEKVPPYIIASMQSLNTLSTFGAHPKDFDPEQLKPVLVNLDIIIKWHLKHKQPGSDYAAKHYEVIKEEIKGNGDLKEEKTISIKRLAGILGVSFVIIALLFVVLYFWDFIGSRRPTKEPDKSIAVLPFRNLSNDTTQLYFSDGIVETILDNLFKVGELKVISGTSTKRYRDTELSIKEIARELGVASILEGSVQKIGNNVRITAQLIDAKNDVHLWSDTYDKDISDIFAIQSEVAQNVAKELKATLTSEEKEQINKYQTQNPEAYNLYLQGRFYIQKRTKEGFEKSIEFYQRAVASDPDYALAYAGLADAYFLLAWFNYMPREEGYTKAKQFVYKALEIDRNLSEAHAVLGGILTWYDMKWEDARKELQLAVTLNPKFVNAHSYYAELLDILRENKEARQQINIALSIDPFFPMMHALSGIFFYHEGKYRESLEEYKKVEEINPSPYNMWVFFTLYARLGEELNAMKSIEKVVSSGTFLSIDLDTLRNSYTSSGLNGVWNCIIANELRKSTPDAISLSIYYLKTGKKEEGLSWLVKAYGTAPYSLPRINNDPDYDLVRSDPSFQAIIKKMGLSEYQTPK